MYKVVDEQIQISLKQYIQVLEINFVVSAKTLNANFTAAKHCEMK
jgi:hypothetical protein